MLRSIAVEEWKGIKEKYMSNESKCVNCRNDTSQVQRMAPEQLLLTTQNTAEQNVRLTAQQRKTYSFYPNPNLVVA